MKISLIIVVVVLFLTIPGYAANIALTLDSYGVVQNGISGELEKQLNSNLSCAAQLLVWNYTGEQDQTLTALASAFGVRKYIIGKVMNGVYLGAYGAGTTVEVKSPTEAKAMSIGAVVTAGYKKVVVSNIVVDVGLSLATPFFTQMKAEGLELDKTAAFGEIGLGLTVGIGYAW